jgi:DNA-binding CsgD family transcriptional regulator
MWLLDKLAKKLPLSDKEKEERVLSLTARERDVYLLLIEGFTLKEAAEQASIKYSTAKTHMTEIYRKLNVNTRDELIINYRDIGK